MAARSLPFSALVLVLASTVVWTLLSDPPRFASAAGPPGPRAETKPDAAAALGPGAALVASTDVRARLADEHAPAIAHAPEIAHGSVLLVRLETAGGEPIRDERALVRLYDAQKRPCDAREEVTADAARRFGPVPDGEYVVEVRFGERLVEQSVRVSGGGEVALTVRSPP